MCQARSHIEPISYSAQSYRASQLSAFCGSGLCFCASIVELHPTGHLDGQSLQAGRLADGVGVGQPDRVICFEA